MSLCRSIKGSPRLQSALLLLVLVGTSMLLGDGVLTCAIEGEPSSQVTNLEEDTAQLTIKVPAGGSCGCQTFNHEENLPHEHCFYCSHLGSFGFAAQSRDQSR